MLGAMACPSYQSSCFVRCAALKSIEEAINPLCLKGNGTSAVCIVTKNGPFCCIFVDTVAINDAEKMAIVAGLSTNMCDTSLQRHAQVRCASQG